MNIFNYISYFGFFNEHGEPVKRDKYKYPYSYDGFVLHRFGENSEANSTIYTDRLLQWDWDKHNELCKKHFGNEGQHWDNRNPIDIESFLRDWTNDPELKLILVMQYCNVSNGYPLWRFDFKSSKK